MRESSPTDAFEPQRLRRYASALSTVSTILEEDERLAINACILGSRAMLEVLAWMNLPARAVVVNVLAGNAEAHSLMERDVPALLWPDSAWTVGVNVQHPPQGPNSYPGHVVVLVEHERLLLDATSAQFQRPQRGMGAIPSALMLPLNEGFTEYVDDAEGSFVAYVRPDRTHELPRHARDWTTNYRDVAGRAIRLLRSNPSLLA